MDVDKRIKYTERILRGGIAQKYRQVLPECKNLEKGLSRYQWTLISKENVTMEQLWNWSKLDNIERVVDIFTGPQHCTYFEKDLWFELGKIMWRKHRSIFQDHMK